MWEGEGMSSIFGGRRPAPATAPAENKPETIIGPTTSLQGHLKAEGTMRIDGGVEGAVEASGNVLVGQGGRVQGNVSGQNVLVAGVVKGNILAAQRLEIVATGRVLGDITVRALLIEEGGLFRGQSIMRDDSQPELLPEAAPAEPARPPAPDPGPVRMASPNEAPASIA
jgi:cytoskeletal protein CcmA (bactofilin family)